VDSDERGEELQLSGNCLRKKKLRKRRWAKVPEAQRGALKITSPPLNSFRNQGGGVLKGGGLSRKRSKWGVWDTFFLPGLNFGGRSKVSFRRRDGLLGAFWGLCFRRRRGEYLSPKEKGRSRTRVDPAQGGSGKLSWGSFAGGSKGGLEESNVQGKEVEQDWQRTWNPHSAGKLKGGKG